MEVYRRSSWLLLLLGVSLLATTLQGVQGEVELEGPSESECRPYIEKALKELETGEPEDGASPELGDSSSKEDVPTIEITTDDSDHQDDGDGEHDTNDGNQSTESVETDTVADAQLSEKEETHEEKSAEESVEEKKSTETKDNVTNQEAVTNSNKNIDNTPDTDVSKETDEADSNKTEENTDVDSKENDTAESTEDKIESIENQPNNAEDNTESGEVKEDSDEQKAKSSEEKAESGEEKADSAEETAESVEEKSVSAEDKAESVGEKAESVEEKAESVEEKAESVEDKAESVENKAESVEDKAESVEEKAASAEDKADSVEDKAESVDDKAESGEGTPSVEETADSKEKEQQDEADSKEGDDSKAASTEEDKKDNVANESEEQKGDSKEDTAENKNDDKDDSKEKDDEKSVEAASKEDKQSAEKDGGEKSGESKEDVGGETKESKENTKEDDDDSTSAEKKEHDENSNEDSEPVPEEDLTLDIEIPTELRPRDHVEQLLKLDEESSETENIINKVSEITLKELKKLYENAIKPLEGVYKYRDLSNRHFGDSEIFSKPLVLFMGPWSGGKSSIINYLVNNEYNETSLRTGAEPSPAYFNILMHGDEPEIIDGTELAADFTFSGLQKFGQGLEERLRGTKLPNKLLEKINIVEIPGILEVRKQVSRVFPFNDACQWFIDRADIIFLVYDPSKLDVGPETEAILDQLKGREHQTRIILNKADQVKPEELMRVQGALIWNISPLMSSPQPPVMYTTSLWSRPYEPWAPVRLLQAQERAFLRDLRTAIEKRIDNKIASARRFAVRVRNHAKMVDCYLTTYYNHKSVFGNRKQVADEIIEHPQDYHIYEGLSTLTNISRYDLPDPEVYKDFFKLNPLYEFQQLSATCTYFRGCPINRLDIAIAYDLPELVGTHKRLVENTLAEANPTSAPPGGS